MCMKRVIAAFLALTLSFGVIGCGKTSTPANGTVSDTAVTETTDSTETTAPTGDYPEPEEEPVEIIWYLYADNNQRDEEIVWEEINKYLKETINVTVNAQFFNYDDMFSKMPVMLNAGDPMDLVFTCSWLNEYIPGATKGSFMELDDLVDQYAPKTKAHVPEQLWDGARVGGKIYCVPTYKEMGQQYGFIFNNEIIKKHNLDVSGIKDYKDVEELFKIVKEKEPNMVILEAPFPLERMMIKNHITGDMDTPGALNIPDHEYYTVENDLIFNQYDTPEFKEFCETMERWQKAGYLPKDTHYETETAPNDWKNQNIFCKGITYAPNEEISLTEQRGYEHIYVPVGTTIVENANVLGSAIAIPQQSKNPRAAMKVIEMLFTDEKFATMIRHGIEGKHWVYAENGTIDFAPEQDPKDPGYDFGIGWEFGSIFTPPLPTSFPENTFEAYEKLNESALPAPSLGFTFNSEPVEAELAAINNVINEYRDPLMWGLVSAEEYHPKFIQALKDAGVDKLLEEQQRQFDEWKAITGE